MSRRQVGSLRKRPDGRWEVRVRIDGKRFSSYHATKAAAKAYIKTLEQADVKGELVQPTDITILEFLNQWLAQAQFRPKTTSDYREFIARHIAPSLGKLKLSQVRPLHIVH